MTPDLVISSPANRAVVTARIIAERIHYPFEEILYSELMYESSEDPLIDITEQIDDAMKKVMLVGLNPALTDFANYIGDHPISNIPTCGVFCVDLDIASWAEM